MCEPMGLAYNALQGQLFIADAIGNEVLRIDSSKRVSTFAGRFHRTPLTGPRSCNPVDGPASAAEFCRPIDVAYDARRNLLFVLDDKTVRRVDPRGYVETFIDQRHQSAVWKCGNEGSDVYVYESCYATSIAFDSMDRSIWVSYVHSIVRFDHFGKPNLLIGGLTGPSYACKPHDGVGITATTCDPSALVFNPADARVYFADHLLIRSVDSDGRVKRFAGIDYPASSGEASDTANQGCRDWDGLRMFSAFCGVSHIVFDNTGNMYVTDSGNEKVKKIDAQGVVSTVAGYYYPFGAMGWGCAAIDGTGADARFCSPDGVAIDVRHHLLFVSDARGGQIREIHL